MKITNKKTVVIALGGNALSPKNEAGTIQEQFKHTRESLKAVLHFVKEDYTHKTNKGYATIHPGRVTHYHAGKTVTEGKRYILVSFCEA